MPEISKIAFAKSYQEATPCSTYEPGTTGVGGAGGVDGEGVVGCDDGVGGTAIVARRLGPQPAAMKAINNANATEEA